jgi:hypothetical protein
MWWVQAPLSRAGGGLRTSCHARGAAWQMSWMEGAWGRLRVHAQVAHQPGYDGYLAGGGGGEGGGWMREEIPTCAHC